jgi:photosystem II stability/assembly factor-like uncharacterized protein
MPEGTRLVAVTGDDVISLALENGRPETALSGVGARCVAVDPHDPERWYVGTFDNDLLTTSDGGATWRAPERGTDEQRVLSVAISRAHRAGGISVAYAGTEPSNLYRSEDGGRSWELLPALRQLPSEPDWSFPPRPWTHHVRTIALHPSDPDSLTVGIELGGVMRSRDGGASWLDHNPQAHSDAHLLLTHPARPDRVYEAAGQGIALSDDRGEHWRRLEHGLDRHYAWAAAADPADPDLWYVSVSRSPFAAHGDGDGQARLLRSDGDGWRPIDGWPDEPHLRRMPYAIATLPDRPRSLLVGLRGGTLLKSEDAGESWSELPQRLSDVIDFALAPG